MISFLGNWTWGTLIGIDGEGPYAVELSYGTDGEYLYCGSRPGGRMWQCIGANPNVAFKVCDTDRSCNQWHAVIVEGKAERLTKYEDIIHSCRTRAVSMGMPKEAFDHMADTAANNPKSNSIRIPLTNISGKAMGC